ncbi:MAG: nicotinate phosphoribosyltransferase [Candidatus Micrarchaeia archaeon]
MFISRENIALLTDLYQLTMSAAYFEKIREVEATFDLFIREMPQRRNYLIAAGLEQALDYLTNFHFTEECISYLNEQKLFKDEFLAYLRKLRFTGEVWAVPEGNVIFPKEPLLRVTAPIIEAQLVETYLLNTIGFQTLIASKAARVVEAARGRGVVDFALRRVHGADAGVKGSRASYIGGCIGTSNVLAGMLYGIPIYGTVAHSFIMAHEREIDAFRNYAEVFPDRCLLLIDTYDTIEGARNAVRVAKELERKEKRMIGVRLDSGDLVKLSKEVRGIFDENNLKYLKIFASGNLDEYKIEKLLKKGAPIDMFGVGTAMGVSSDSPVVNGNYKLVELRDERGNELPRMKLSTGKVTLPGKKQIYRFYRNKLYSHDVIALEEEKLNGEKLLVKFMEKGKVTKKLPKLNEIRENCRKNISKLPEKYRKLSKAPPYPVLLSKKLQKLVEEMKRKYSNA